MKTKSKTNQILLIDKPKGITSFDVIRKLRKKLGIRKMGHAGTLDPLATGLLIIGIEEGTKKLKDLIGLDKEYEVEILLGTKTDTGDISGRIIEQKKVTSVNKSSIEKVLSSMVGKLKLPVPVYSAIKQGGEPLYKKARRGEKVDVPIKEMQIYNIVLHGDKPHGDGHILEITMNVSSGTYVRSIAEEIGKRLAPTQMYIGVSSQSEQGLGVPATVKELRRTKVGEYVVEKAESIK